MQRILSFQMARNIEESSEYVTKRICCSLLFSIGFMCLVCGFLLGRFTTHEAMKTQALKTRFELKENGLWNTKHLQQSALEELERISFDYDRITDWKELHLIDVNLRYLKGFFFNLSFTREVTEHASSVRATVRGSREPDRYVVLSVNRDNVAIALELAQVLDRICSAHNWQPRRSLLFCVSLAPLDECPQTLSDVISRRKATAYVAIHSHRHFAQNNGVILTGSDVVQSIAIEAIKTIPGESNWTYLEHETFHPRLSLDIPQLIFSFSNSTRSQMHRDQSLRGVTPAQMICQTIWRLSESIVIQWEPKYFNKTINRTLESIDIDKSRDTKEKLWRTLKILLAAVKNLNIKIDATERTQELRVRMWNDLLLDLDRALLCPDEGSHSKTDLAILRKLALESTDDEALAYLDEMAKCYENAIQVIQES